MTDTEIICPDCGLVLRIRDYGACVKFNYGMTEWQRRCMYRGLGIPRGACCSMAKKRKG